MVSHPETGSDSPIGLDRESGRDNLDDYNLTYNQNKNKGFEIFFTATPLKTQHFPFYKNSSKPIQTNTNQQYTSKLNLAQPQN